MERSRNDNYLLCICSQNNNGLRGSPNATLKSALQVMRSSERPLDNLNFGAHGARRPICSPHCGKLTASRGAEEEFEAMCDRKKYT